MHLITRSCVLLLWMHALTFVKSKDCTLEQFLNSRHYDSNFDTTGLEASYVGGRQVRVGCNVGFSGFFKLTCVEGQWQSRGTKCQPRSCGHPGDAQFADFHLEKGDDFVFGSEVVYTCHKGYQMVSRSHYRRCMAEGWDGVVPVCEAQQCPVIHVANNVQVNGDPEEATFGNVVRFSCKSSTEILLGQAELYCDESGQWNDEPPKCEAIKCTVPVIENGLVTGDDRDYNEHEVLHFACISKYTRAEDRPSKCMKIGTKAEWSPTPACQPIKCRLELSSGTRYEPASRNVFSPGDTVRVTCGEKQFISEHRLQSAETTCRDDGKWTVEPVCKEVICIDPRDRLVSNWRVQWWQQIKLDETVDYDCRRGYKRTGDVRRATCTRDEWTPKPLCQEIICNSLDVIIPHANIGNDRQYKNNERAYFDCEEGYKGRPTRICGPNEIKCDRLDLPNANIVRPKWKYEYREEVSYDCEEGYKGRPTRTCGENGWTGDSQCEEIKCDRLDLPNANIVRPKWKYEYREEVSYVCKEGYEGRPTRTCGKNGWTGNSQCEETMCEQLNIPNARIIYNNKERYSHRERVYYGCGDKQFIVTCELGNWKGIENCSACPTAHIEHGFVVYSSYDKLYYACNKDFKLFTKGWWGEAKCVDRKWTGLRRCIGIKNCGEIPSIPNAVMIPSNEVHRPGQRIPITCRTGYRAQVNHLTCDKGKWISEGAALKTVCEPLAQHCGPPPKVLNAIVKTSYEREYLSGTEVTYECRNKYLMEGRSMIQCTDGKWEKKNITCTQYCDKLKDERQTMNINMDEERYSDGHVLHYHCIVPDGKTNGTATCVTGMWNKTVECQAPGQDNHDADSVPDPKKLQ